MTTCTLELTQARDLIKRIGSKLGCDFTYDPQLVEGRQDVCVVRHTTENGSTYGYDTLYLVWVDNSGQLRHREIANSRETKDYIFTLLDKPPTAEGDVITVHYGSGGTYSGKSWDKTVELRVN